MTIKKSLQFLYYYILFYYYHFYYQIIIRLGLYKNKKIETFMDSDQKYIAPIKAAFSKFISSSIKKSANIDSIFYDKKAYTIYMTEPYTELERLWKTRIIFENTPRGNILMFYDSYKLGFSYYCDQKTVSYDILNAAAMKYVSMYRCLDFFVDETEIQKDPTPFIKLYFSEDPKKMDVFSKMKKEKTLENEQIKNRFIYMGKMNNYNWLQSMPKKRKVLAKFTSPLLEGIINDSGVQRETISYRDYKKSLVSSIVL